MTEVLIIGGGIGGLCLAHGLRQAGIPVTVFERTTERTDWLQGYRIHINPHGSAALHACLPSPSWQRFLDTVSTEGGGFGFITEQGKTLLELGADLINPSSDAAQRHYGVSRIKLREVLLSGLDDVVRLGKSFERYELTPDGRVTAHFADGTSATGDLLIGADGANSLVRKQFLPHAERVDTGVLAIAGKHPRHKLPLELATRANLVAPRGRGFMFTAVWAGDDPTDDYTFWAYADAADHFDLTGTDLKQTVLKKITHWGPALKQLVAGSDPATVNVVRIRSAAPVKKWPTGPVTLLGDAIHNMTPMAGIGANTALRDADLLRRKLIGAQSLTAAVADYEREMLDYGFKAVKMSYRNAKRAASANRLGRMMFRGVLRLTAAIPLLKRKMAGSFGN